MARLEHGIGTTQELERFRTLRKSYERQLELYNTSRRPVREITSRESLDVEKHSTSEEMQEWEALYDDRIEFMREYLYGPEGRLEFDRLSSGIGTPKEL